MARVAAAPTPNTARGSVSDLHIAVYQMVIVHLLERERDVPHDCHHLHLVDAREALVLNRIQQVAISTWQHEAHHSLTRCNLVVAAHDGDHALRIELCRRSRPPLSLELVLIGHALERHLCGLAFRRLVVDGESYRGRRGFMHGPLIQRVAAEEPGRMLVGAVQRLRKSDYQCQREGAQQPRQQRVALTAICARPAKAPDGALLALLPAALAVVACRTRLATCCCGCAVVSRWTRRTFRVTGVAEVAPWAVVTLLCATVAVAASRTRLALRRSVRAVVTGRTRRALRCTAVAEVAARAVHTVPVAGALARAVLAGPAQCATAQQHGATRRGRAAVGHGASIPGSTIDAAARVWKRREVAVAVNHPQTRARVDRTFVARDVGRLLLSVEEVEVGIIKHCDHDSGVVWMDL